jgi:hypothetical protein
MIIDVSGRKSPPHMRYKTGELLVESAAGLVRGRQGWASSRISLHLQYYGLEAKAFSGLYVLNLDPFVQWPRQIQAGSHGEVVIVATTAIRRRSNREM